MAVRQAFLCASGERGYAARTRSFAKRKSERNEEAEQRRVTKRVAGEATCTATSVRQSRSLENESPADRSLSSERMSDLGGFRGGFL